MVPVSAESGTVPQIWVPETLTLVAEAQELPVQYWRESPDCRPELVKQTWTVAPAGAVVPAGRVTLMSKYTLPVERAPTPVDGPDREEVVTTALVPLLSPEIVADTPVVPVLSTVALPELLVVTLFEVLVTTLEPYSPDCASAIPETTRSENMREPKTMSLAFANLNWCTYRVGN